MPTRIGTFMPGWPNSDGAQQSAWSGTIENLEGAETITVSNWLGFLPLIVNEVEMVPPMMRRTIVIDPTLPQVTWRLPPYPHVAPGQAPHARPCLYVLDDPAPVAQIDPVTVPTGILDRFRFNDEVGPELHRQWRNYGNVESATVLSPLDTDLGDRIVLTRLRGWVRGTNMVDPVASGFSSLYPGVIPQGCTVMVFPNLVVNFGMTLWRSPVGAATDYYLDLDLQGAAMVQVHIYQGADGSTADLELWGAPRIVV